MSAEPTPGRVVPFAGRLSPGRLRRVLERLGPTFVKLGQYLALRPDLLDDAYCDELLRLVDQVPAEPFGRVRATLAADLGQDAEAAFAWFSRRPVGAASLAQVYRARTHDGAEVAVKVQRSDARERVARDLRRARWLGRLLRRAGLQGGIRVGEVIAQLEHWLRDELDLELERRNLARIHSLAQSSRIQVVPRPHPELSGPRVLTAQYLTGVPFSVILRYVREDRPEAVERFGLDRRRLAENLIEAALEQVFRFRVFQADMHPGNIVALPGNAIGFVDFGLVETLDPTLEAGLFRYVRAVYRNDTDELLRGLQEILIPGESADPEGFRRAFIEETRRLRRERGGPDGDGGDGTSERQDRESPVGRYLIGVLRAAREHDMRLPSGVLAIYRSLLTAESVAYQLGGEADIGSVGRRFFAELQLESLLKLRQPETVAGDLQSALDTLRTVPGNLERLLRDLASDRFRLRVESIDSAQDRRLKGDQTRLITAALVLVGLGAMLGPAQGVTLPGGLGLDRVLWGLAGLDLLYLLLLWRRLP